MKQLDVGPTYIFFKSELKLVCSKKINGEMWLKLYENMKIFGG